ncbi:MAG: hypothetical protein V7644_1686 [Actinomycetota bacterium]
MEFLERYLLLGLRLGRHVDGFVDAYYGPRELAAQVEGEAPAPPGELAADAAALAGELPFDDEHRNAWLRAQLAGCETTARRLAGEPVGWADEVERCYGVRPEPVPEERFAQAQEQLDAALPGGGELAARYRAWVERQGVPPDKLLPAAARFEQELRTRTDALVGLPQGEAVELETVQNEPWSGFNYYLGGRRSRVVVNTDLPVYSFALPGLVAHEVYPGHHTEHAWKEALLVDGEGRLEESLFLTGTPQAVLSEGIAMLAPELGFAGDEGAVAAEVYATLGVEYEAEPSAAAREFRSAIEGMSANAAWQLHEEGRPQAEVEAYLLRWGLGTPERAAKSISFLTHPTWRAYVSCYSAGYELCRRFVHGDARRFRRLLTEQLTTGDLLAAA